MANDLECSPVGLAIVAPPKSGSTFIAALIKALAFEAATCRIASMHFRCSTTVMVGCPTDGARCHRHGRNGKSDLRMLCAWGSQPDNNRSFALPAGCCAVARPSATSDLLDAPSAGDGSTPVEQFPHKRDCQARSVDDWLAEQPRAWAWGPPRAHLLELRDLGRLETPPKELVDTELRPWFHDQGTHERPASKCEEPEDWGARSPVHVQRPLVVLSRYEAMTADFDGWFKALLDTLPDGMVARAGASRAQIHRAMLALFRRDFVADGRHRHSLVPGSNLARLLPASVHRLQGHARLVSVMDRLGYDFQMTVKV